MHSLTSFSLVFSFFKQPQDANAEISPHLSTTATSDQMGIISMSLELQREAGEYLASLRIRERPNNGVRLLIDTTSSTTTTRAVMKMEQVEEVSTKLENNNDVEMNNNMSTEMNVDQRYDVTTLVDERCSVESDSEGDDEIWEGIASHLLTSDDIVPLGFKFINHLSCLLFQKARPFMNK